jgi:poly-gamma-glutamate capsule biosynthesis protein CapA/YwtB (metallophosphatase superfamily)
MAAVEGVGRRGLIALAAATLLGGCFGPSPTPPPSAGPAGPSPAATDGASSPEPSPSPSGLAYPASFPLAVVTGNENLVAWTDLKTVTGLAKSGSLIVPCGIEVTEPPLTSTAPCLPGDKIAAAIQAKPTTVALLPAGLVEPATKTLPIGGTEPYGIDGADLFGDPAQRAQAYPIVGRATDPSAVPVAWLAYDPGQVWTMSSVGGVCSDRGAAYQALVLGKGWEWLFDGGTAVYKGEPHPNPNPPAGISVFPVVTPVATGNDGLVAKLISAADLTIADVECPIVPAAKFVPNYGSSLTFSISDAVLPLWRDKLGFDVVYMAANHNTDKGAAGVASSIKLLDGAGIEHVGVGMNFDEAMTPAFVERAGVKIAFVAWNDVPGVTKATATRAGVPWITKANVEESVRRARAGGAQLVICDPQWWGGAEYHSDLRNAQFGQLALFDEAGCDEVIGAGTHFAGPMLLRQLNGHLGLVMASEGNLVFGQDWWQDTQEGILMTVAFRGTQLVNVHNFPYVMVANARGALTDPTGDGHYVMQRVWQNSTVDYLP